tara:strand:- start:708 stop:905 length:198 start_codon:yes stop_codon:yes gene_type:complete
MLFLGLEIIGIAIIFYSMKELFSCKNTEPDIRTTRNYQPPPRYEENNQSVDNINTELEPPPSYRE